MPAKVSDHIRTIAANNPDWQITVWTPASSAALIESKYPELATLYHGLPFPIQRSDMSRYAILHAYGGLYMDVDYNITVPLSSITAYLRETFPFKSAFVNGTPNGVIVKRASNSFMVAPVVGHAFWKHVLMLCNEGSGVSSHRRVMTGTGPQIIDLALRTYDGADVGVLPMSLFNPCDLCENGGTFKCRRGGAGARPRCAEGCYAYHMNDGSWNSVTTKAFNTLFCKRLIIMFIVGGALLLIIVALSVYIGLSRKRGCML